MRVLCLTAAILLFIGPVVPAQDNRAARVAVAPVTRETLAKPQSFIGTLYHERVSRISSEVAGLVSRIDVNAGDRVKQSEPIVTLDTQMLDKEILIQKNILARARLRMAHAGKNHDRIDMLFKKGSASEKAYDDAGFEYETAQLETLSAETMLEKLLLRKRKSTIYAPFDGIILDKFVDRGDWVQQGKSLVEIGADAQLFVRVPVAETLLTSVSVGQQVDISITAYNRQIRGIIDSLGPVADEKTKNVFLKIKIEPMTDVVQNMSAVVSIPTGPEAPLFMIPRDALVKFQGSDSVFIIQDGKALAVPVRIAAYSGDRFGTDSSELETGMQVVVEGNERLQPGQAVTVIKEP